MGFKRWVRHWLITPRRVHRVLPPASLERIRAAIAQTETLHSGEIRFAIESSLPWSYLRRNAPARQRAAMVFGKLRVWDTEANNGVLLYVGLADHAIEIVADRGIARHVPRHEWEAICNVVREHFRRDDYEAGVIAGVDAIGKLLAQHFPLAAGEVNPNELSDRPAIL
ncbi:MAG: TPM domain-containing protein [Gemmatimonadota bacterium]